MIEAFYTVTENECHTLVNKPYVNEVTFSDQNLDKKSF